MEQIAEAHPRISIEIITGPASRREAGGAAHPATKAKAKPSGVIDKRIL